MSSLVYMHFIESKLYNKGITKIYAGVIGNPIATEQTLKVRCNNNGSGESLAKPYYHYSQE